MVARQLNEATDDPSPEKFLRARITQRQEVSADLWAIGVDPGGELAPGPRD
jgi:hypothetical protein